MAQIIKTADGSNSLRHEVLGELYHSDRGAVGESIHVFIDRGLQFVVDKGVREINIFEVGFGSGLNCWLTLQRAKDLGVKINYSAIELYPVDMETVKGLGYGSDDFFYKMHSCVWGEKVDVCDFFTLKKYNSAMESFDFYQLKDINLVYFDAFSPDVQPQLWSEAVFGQLYDIMTKGGVVVTYTSKGVVKQNMRNVGYDVLRLEGALGKRHMVRAIKP